MSTNPDADPDRTAYEATDWRIVQSTDEYDFFNYVDRSMVADNKGYETQGEYGDELVLMTTKPLPCGTRNTAD